MQLEPSMDPCVHCGACFSLCDWDAAVQRGERPGPEICRGCQTCYRICPRLPHDRAALAAALFPEAPDLAWGRALTAHSAWAVQPGPDVQDGGLATALTMHLLRQGQVEAVLVTGRDEAWRPRSFWATSPAEVLTAAGSKYSTAPALRDLASGIQAYERVAIIALPCQCAALARLRQARPAYDQRIALVIGLFCSKTFVHGGPDAGLTGFVETRLNRRLCEVDRFDIRRGRFIVRAGEQTGEWRIKELAELAWPICAACPDLSAEYADISLGSIGSSEGRNTLLVRSSRGQALVAAASDAGLLQLEPLEIPEALEKLCRSKQANAQALSDDQRQILGRNSIRGNWHRQCRPGN